MNCKNCGNSLNGEKFCPNCGASTEITLNNGQNGINETGNNQVNIPSNMNFNSVQSGGVNTNVNNDIGFDRDFEKDLNQFGQNNIYYNQQNMTNNQVNVQPNTNNMQQEIELPNSKKGILPLIIVGALFFIVVIGIGITKLIYGDVTIYEGEKYSLRYNSSWSEDTSQDKMTLYYEDGKSRLLLNAVTSFKELNASIETEDDRKKLYESFYKIWSDVDGGELTGGTGTFEQLNEDSLYARVNYKITDQTYVGAFYIVLSEKYDTVISFMSYCTEESWEVVDADILEMLASVTYSNESLDNSDSDSSSSSNSRYGKFSAGSTKEYTSLGYMDYKVPECWTYDEEKSKEVQYKSYIFRFKDGVSLLDIKGVTPYDSSTMAMGTTYEKMKEKIIKTYGAIKNESTKTINGKKWYVIVTPDYTSGGKSYHNEIYFALSKNNVNLYYLEAYIYNDSTSGKDEYITDSVEYILESATLYKVDE